MGYLYVLQNEVEHGHLDLYKIGYSKGRQSLANRAKQLRSSAVVGNFAYKYVWEIDETIAITEVEDAVHLKLRQRREKRDREFFRGPLRELVSEISGVLTYMGIEPNLLHIESAPPARDPRSKETPEMQRVVRQNAKTQPKGVEEEPEFELFRMEELTAPLERFDDGRNSWLTSDFLTRKGISKDRMAWFRALYWLSPALIGEYWHISISLQDAKADIRYIPPIEQASDLVDFESTLVAQQKSYAPLANVSVEHPFMLSWHSRRSFTNLSSIHPSWWTIKEASTHGIGRVDSRYCWEIGLEEGMGYPFFGVSRPLPKRIAEEINDPTLKVWTRAVWQLLKANETASGIWELPMPECPEAPARIEQVVSLLASFGYTFPESHVKAVASMWNTPLEISKTGDRLDAERNDRSKEYSRSDLEALQVLLKAGLNNRTELSSRDLELIERGRGGARFLDSEFEEFRRALAKVNPLIKWFNSPRTRQQIKTDLRLKKFKRDDETVVQWLRSELPKQQP